MHTSEYAVYNYVCTDILPYTVDRDVFAGKIFRL